MLTFKDFLTVDLKPGEDEYIKYRNQKRRRGAMSAGEGGPVGEDFTAEVITDLLSEEINVDKLMMLARGGLVDNITTFRRVLKKLDTDKVLVPAEREVIYSIFNKFADLVTNDPAIFTKARKSVKEDVVLSEGPLVVSKAQANNMLMNFIQDALKSGKQADLEKLAAAVGKKMTIQGKRVVFEGEEYDMDDIYEAVLDTRQRIAKKMQMRRLKAKLKIGRKRAKLKRANPDKIKMRAQKRARMAVFKKLSKGKSKDEMSYSERKAVEKRVEQRKGMITRIAKRLLPKVRKDDVTRKKIIGPSESSQAPRPQTH